MLTGKNIYGRVFRAIFSVTIVTCVIYGGEPNLQIKIEPISCQRRSFKSLHSVPHFKAVTWHAWPPYLEKYNYSRGNTTRCEWYSTWISSDPTLAIIFVNKHNNTNHSYKGLLQHIVPIIMVIYEENNLAIHAM